MNRKQDNGGVRFAVLFANEIARRHLLWIALGCLLSPLPAPAGRAPAAKPFERFDGCVLEPDEWTNAHLLKRGRLEPVSPHNVTVIGKAFYDTDHAKKGINQRNGHPNVAAWEIHPVMKVIDGDARLGSAT